MPKIVSLFKIISMQFKHLLHKTVVPHLLVLLIPEYSPVTSQGDVVKAYYCLLLLALVSSPKCQSLLLKSVKNENLLVFIFSTLKIMKRQESN